MNPMGQPDASVVVAIESLGEVWPGALLDMVLVHSGTPFERKSSITYPCFKGREGVQIDMDDHKSVRGYKLLYANCTGNIRACIILLDYSDEDTVVGQLQILTPKQLSYVETKRTGIWSLYKSKINEFKNQDNAIQEQLLQTEEEEFEKIIQRALFLEASKIDSREINTRQTNCSDINKIRADISSRRRMKLDDCYTLKRHREQLKITMFHKRKVHFVPSIDGSNTDFTNLLKNQQAHDYNNHAAPQDLQDYAIGQHIF
ncbi:hypothetical protein FF38_00613 [Lucilia cuprina]|uniref:Uncharacterized protein n=1 Tax=Lucilia cuprina TaxID=7375 RepID=A0A0L0C3U4_LUCCU|nr:hypothetical protein FF38_00613 [Lucilia cuprina]